jgi:hypothetical protein
MTLWITKINRSVDMVITGIMEKKILSAMPLNFITYLKYRAERKEPQRKTAVSGKGFGKGKRKYKKSKNPPGKSGILNLTSTKETLKFY